MKRRERIVKLALPVPGALRDVTVTEARARWKARHVNPSERMIRMLRYLWMRGDFRWEDRYKLHGGTLGALLRAGLAWQHGTRMRSEDYRRYT